MPDTIDWPLHTTPQPHRSKILLLIGLIVVVFIAGRIALSLWIDLLWFRSLSYSGVFWTALRLQWGIFAIFAVLTFLVLYGAFYALRRAHQGDLPDTHTIVFGGQPISFPVASVLHFVAIAVSLLIAIGTGAAMKAQWPSLALYWYAPSASGSVVDPILGKPLNFYLFSLPVWDLLAGWLVTLGVLCCILSALFLLVAGGGRALSGRLSSSIPLPWRGISVAAGFLLLAIAFRTYVGRFEMLFEHHTIFAGVSYTDAHVTLTGMLIVCVALVIGAMIAIAGGVMGAARRVAGRGAVVPAIICYAIVGIAGWYVTTFLVRPNQLDRERPYIEYNIAMTRQAYGLDRFSQFEFPAETNVAAADPANNQATLQNIRLWDVQALQDTLRQVQEIRTYYDFPDIDIDRYQLNGSLREVMLAVRELNVDKLPESSHNWINDKLIYTHGYGITMNPVNGFTPEEPAHAVIKQYAGAEHSARPQRYAARNLLRRNDRHRRVRKDRPAGVQLP